MSENLQTTEEKLRRIEDLLEKLGDDEAIKRLELEPSKALHGKLWGQMVYVGDLEVNGDEAFSGVAIEIDRSVLIAAKCLPLYRDVEVVLLDMEIAQVKRAPEVPQPKPFTRTNNPKTILLTQPVNEGGER